MEVTPRKPPRRSTPAKPKPSPPLPPTPESTALRRSLRRTTISDPKAALTPSPAPVPPCRPETPRSGRKTRRSLLTSEPASEPPSSFFPATPHQPSEPKRRRRSYPPPPPPEAPKPKARAPQKRGAPKRRVYYKKVVYDGSEFEVGDDVYVKRREGGESDNEDPEVEACRICFREGGTMIECDDCLGGFHLKCLRPPLRQVPEGDWICGYCEAHKMGKVADLPKPPEGMKLRRTAKEKLLSSDLWAARIER